MKKIPFIAMLLVIWFFSCGEKEEGPEILPDDVLFVKAKIDGQDYEYSYKLQENYLDKEGGPNFNQIVPNKGINYTLLYGEVLSFDIQHGCNSQPGKNACVFLEFSSLTSIGKNTDPFFAGVIPGDEPKFLTRNYSYYSNGNPLPLEVIFKNYDPIKFTIEGSFKGKVEFINAVSGESKVIDLEGTFKCGAKVN
jgi:hypothetical protein